MVKRGPLLGLKHQKEKRSMDHFAGLDVSVKETSICIVDDTGRIVREVKVASEPEALLQVLGNPIYRFKRIGLEAGPLSQWLFSALAEAGLPVICVKQRGVVFDIGHGGGSFDYTVAEAAIQQGCLPDTISSDIHVFSGNTPGMPYLTWVMSKFMGLGFSLEDVVAMATIKPAAVINRTPKLGSLQVGAPGDVAIMDVVEGPVSFVGTSNNKR